MQITFDMPQVFYPGANAEANARALRTLLECLISLNGQFLETHTAPSLYDSGVRYRRTMIWDTIPALYARQYGDCKSLTAALIAEYRMQGIEAKPVFRFMPVYKGKLIFHILVQTAEGFEDPSKILGMGREDE
jgi:hypothetical protein